MQKTRREAIRTLKEAVERLPSTMARLAFLSGLRDQNSGTYRVPAVPNKAEALDVDGLARSLHEHAFATWLDYRLEEQKADLDLYFSDLDCETAAAVRTWIRLEPYRSFIPESASAAGRGLFLSDLGLLLYLMAHDDPDFAKDVARRAIGSSFLTTQELAEWLGVSPRTVCMWAECHDVPAVKAGKQWRFPLNEIREWLKTRWAAKPADYLPHPTTAPPASAPQSETPACPLRCARNGISNLSPREQEVLALIGEGKGTKQIAALMSIAESTVAEYRKRMCRRLGLHSATELAVCAVGWCSGRCRNIWNVRKCRAQS